MSDLTEALKNPFSPENAWITFRNNMTEAGRLKQEVLREKDTGRLTDRELVLKATEALGRLTDNTILLRIVEKALKARDDA